MITEFFCEYKDDFSGGVNVDIPALTLSDPLPSGSHHSLGSAGLCLVATLVLWGLQD